MAAYELQLLRLRHTKWTPVPIRSHPIRNHCTKLSSGPDCLRGGGYEPYITQKEGKYLQL